MLAACEHIGQSELSSDMPIGRILRIRRTNEIAEIPQEFIQRTGELRLTEDLHFNLFLFFFFFFLVRSMQPP
jgi:hypothetical protein